MVMSLKWKHFGLMRLPINLQKDYTQNTSGYQLKLPLNIETIIPEDDSVRLLSQFVEAMDLTDLYSTYERINSVSPRTLLKIVLYSYMNGDYSSRSMELNCRRDINFMFPLEGFDQALSECTAYYLYREAGVWQEYTGDAAEMAAREAFGEEMNADIAAEIRDARTGEVVKRL